MGGVEASGGELLIITASESGVEVKLMSEHLLRVQVPRSPYVHGRCGHHKLLASRVLSSPMDPLDQADSESRI